MPPFLGQWPEAPAGFAPYLCELQELSDHLGHSAERRKLILGFLTLRERLRAMGVEIVLQWIDGSFVERIEASGGRQPKDIDVMTFLRRPPHAKLDAEFLQLIHANIELFDRDQCKAQFHCDHFFMDLDAAVHIDQICYWHSLFSHRRDGAWKGYLQIGPESQVADNAVRTALLAKGVTT
jgi:hypothetical protein